MLEALGRVDVVGAPGSAEYAGSWLPERTLLVSREEVATADWPVRSHLRDPAQELYQMGRRAIPVLLENASSPTLTREGHGRTVGQLALEVLEGFAYRRLRSSAEASRWWEEAKTMSDVDVVRLGLETDSYLREQGLLALVEHLAWDATDEISAFADNDPGAVVAALRVLERRRELDPPSRQRDSAADAIVRCLLELREGGADSIDTRDEALGVLVRLDSRRGIEAWIAAAQSGDELFVSIEPAVKAILSIRHARGRRLLREVLASPDSPMGGQVRDALFDLCFGQLTEEAADRDEPPTAAMRNFCRRAGITPNLQD